MCAQHRVGARRRYETWPLRSAPCLSSQPDRSLRRRVCLAASQSCAQRATGCGYVDNAKGVAHISTAPSSSSSQIQFDDNEKESRTALTVLSQQRPGARPANPLQCHCAIFTRILTAIHKWHQVELGTGRLHVRRSKRGTPCVHPMQGDEIRALRRLPSADTAAAVSVNAACHRGQIADAGFGAGTRTQGHARRIGTAQAKEKLLIGNYVALWQRPRGMENALQASH